VGLKGRAIIDDPLAFTELYLVFDNPEDRVLEGNFNIVLPQGAAISRFAMKNEQGWQEGEVVGRQKARAAYEDFLHRRQDPALLEQNAGNEFSARVFPIPPRGRKEIIVSYQQELTPATPYVLPLKGLPQIGEIDVEAHLAGHAAPLQKLAQRNVAPAADFRLEAKPPGGRRALRNAEIVVARVAPVVGSQPEPLGAALVLVDTSASRALGMVDAARIVAELCASMAKAHGDRGRVMVAAYDQLVEPIYDGHAAGFGTDALKRVRQRLALGASDLGAALGWAGKEAQARGISRIVLVTDGVATAGATAGDKLRAVAAGLRVSGIERIDAVAVGGIRDDELLKSVANAGLGHGGVVIDGDQAPAEIWRRLSEATRSNLKVDVEGAKFVFPRVVGGVQAGDEILVYATVPEGQAMQVSIGGGPVVRPEPVRAERPLLERAWVGAKIRSLLEEERTQGPSEQLSNEIVGLSTRYRVLSPKSALLVLESEGDYARFGIDRRALADILVAEGGRVTLLARPPPVVAKPPPPPEPPPRTAVRARVTDKEIRIMPSTGRQHAEPLSKAAPRPDVSKAEETAPRRIRAVEQPPATPATAPAPEPPPATTPAPAPPVPRPPASSRFRASEPEDRDGVDDGTPARSPPRAWTGPDDDHDGILDDHDGCPDTGGDRRDGGSGARRDGNDDYDRCPDTGGAANPPKEDPYTGPFKTVMELLRDRKVEPAVKAAFEWRKTAPGDVMALVALGEGFEAAGDFAQAARCYGSIVDLFPSRADLRRFAGERLERLPAAAGLDLALDTFAKSVEQRPDHPGSHRLYAYALLRKGRMEQAFAAIVAGLKQPYPPGRFAGVPRILAEDVGLIGAAWARAEPKRAAEILSRVRAEGGSVEDQPSIRFVLNWETDANDVDFHIYDAGGDHAFYNNKTLPSGGELYADVTTGYGPECFTIRAPVNQRRGPYKLQAHYYSRGPMGYGMGKLEIIEHDGRGGLRFEERPFVVMVDHGFVDLGTVK
jgi:hypothetical protein